MPTDPMKKLMANTMPGRPQHRMPSERRIRGRHIFLFLLLCGLAFGAYKKLYVPWAAAPVEVRQTNEVKVQEAETPPQPQPQPQPPPSAKPENSEKYEIRHHVAQAGESLAGIVESLGISGEYIGDLGNACKSAPLDRVKEDDELILFVNRADGQPVKMIFSPSDGTSYTLRRSAAGWECRSQDDAPRGPAKTVRGRYSENFYDSCIAAGVPVSLISNLGEIFSFDFDLTSELKDGDTFSVFFQEQSIEGTEGRKFLILAAEMNASGKSVHAFGFQTPDGWEYYDSKGASLERAFLRSPISYRRMMSPSTYKNIKPVLKIYRPRLGIDYAAPRGTPVSAIGDGVVSSVKKSKTGIISVEIKHRGGFRSVYGNLSGYSRGLKRESIVSQGEVIGSVGAGVKGKPYLDFRLLKNGKPVNFETTDFPRTKFVPKGMTAEFEKLRDLYAAALQGKMPEGRNQEALSGRD